ncbi:hypothetical protein Tco_0398537 [Tanacetum coccineum]
MEIPCSNKIKFITACSFSNDSFEDIMKAQVSVIKASATLNIQAFKIKKSTGTLFNQDSGLQDGNTRNGRATVQVHEANLHKRDANVPNDAYFDIWLPLASVYEVNDRMKNSLYGYFIVKRLALPVVEWIGVDSVLRDGLWMIHGVPIFKINGLWKRISDKRTKNQAKTDKTKHGMEKRGKAKVN